MKTDVSQEASFVGSQKTFLWAFKRILLSTYIRKESICFYDMDHDEETLRIYLWNYYRLKELCEGKTTPTPFILFGLKEKNRFLKNPKNKVFYHREFGYSYFSKPLSIYEFFIVFKEIKKYTFPSIERFKMHIKEFSESRWLLNSLIHSIRDDSPKTELNEVFSKILFLIENESFKEEIKRCIENKFPSKETKDILLKIKKGGI